MYHEQFLGSNKDHKWSYECSVPLNTFLRCVEQKWLSDIKVSVSAVNDRNGRGAAPDGFVTEGGAQERDRAPSTDRQTENYYRCPK